MTQSIPAPMAAAGKLGQALADMDLSGDELNKFEKAFQDPEFIKMFGNYVTEMQDPKNRAETEAYLKQLEQQGQVESVYGAGAQLIVPAPEFVVKTRFTASDKKIFVNLCSSDKVGKPSAAVTTNAAGAKGQSWSIPLLLSKPRDGVDRHGAPAAVYDFTVHPDTVRMARSNARFLSITVDSALERIEQMDGAAVRRDFQQLKMKFKALRGGASESVDGHIKPQNRPPAAPTQTKEQQPAAAPTRSSFAFPGTKPNPKKTPAQPEKPSDAGYRHAGGEVTPAYELVHSGAADLGDAWSDKGIHSTSCHPRNLTLRVLLPGLASAAKVDLDVGPQRADLRVPGKYLLTVDLPYAVDDTKGRARFDRAACLLSVTLPVLPPQPALQPNVALAAASLVEELPAETAPQPACATEPAPASNTRALPPSSSGAVSSDGGGGHTEASRRADEPGNCKQEGASGCADAEPVSAAVAGEGLRDGAGQRSGEAAADAACESAVAATGSVVSTAEPVAATGGGSEPDGLAATGAPNLKALAQRWSQVNAARDSARAGPGSQGACAADAGDANSAAHDERNTASDADSAAAGGEAGSPLGAAGSAGGAGAMNPTEGANGGARSAQLAPRDAAPAQHTAKLTPSLQMSFVDELD